MILKFDKLHIIINTEHPKAIHYERYEFFSTFFNSVVQK